VVVGCVSEDKSGTSSVNYVKGLIIKINFNFNESEGKRQELPVRKNPGFA
jgi:hypothetical protein